MSLLTIQEAAQRIGADEQTIRQWIEQGLLKSLTRRTCEPDEVVLARSATYPVVTRWQFEVVVDEEELEEVAERDGWLRISASAIWNDAEE